MMKLRIVVLCMVAVMAVSYVLPAGMGMGQATAVYAQDCGVDFEFQEQNGLVVIEIESEPAVGDWAEETIIDDYTGDSYYRWNGGNQFGSPGIDVLEYKIGVDTPGKYRFVWRGRITTGTSGSEHNDAFLRFPDADEFYGEQNGGSRVYPRGNGRGPGGTDQTPYPEGTSGEGYFKIYLNTVGSWRWDARTSDNDAHDVFVEFDNAGVYTLQVSGRSQDFGIDRMVLYKVDTYSFDSATSTSQPETRCSDNPLQIVGTDPEDGATGINGGQDITISFSEPATVNGQWFNMVCPPSDYVATIDNSAVSQDLTSYIIDPDDNPPNGYTCDITIFANQVRDSNNQPLPGGDYTFSYTRAGNARPLVVSTTPEDEATEVNPNSDIEITFSESVTTNTDGSGWFDIDCESVTDIRGDEATVTGNGATRTVDPDEPLPSGELCTFLVRGGEVRDSDDESLLGGSYTFSFTTGTPLPGVNIVQSAGSTVVTEGGATDTYEVTLNTPPTADVMVAINSGNQISTSEIMLTFTTENWDTVQEVIVTAVEDDTIEGIHADTISHTVSSDDNDYDGITAPTVAITILDSGTLNVFLPMIVKE